MEPAAATELRSSASPEWGTHNLVAGCKDQPKKQVKRPFAQLLATATAGACSWTLQHHAHCACSKATVYETRFPPYRESTASPGCADSRK